MSFKHYQHFRELLAKRVPKKMKNCLFFLIPEGQFAVFYEQGRQNRRRGRASSTYRQLMGKG
jgi:hypothetical protein